MAKHSCFCDAALAAQEQSAVEYEGKAMAMMFALLQKQHKAQIDALTAGNKKAMDTMLVRMNALVSGSRFVDKENAVPTSNIAAASTIAKPPKRKSKNCGKTVYHKPK
jgi:hypothetical protein